MGNIYTTTHTTNIMQTSENAKLTVLTLSSMISIGVDSIVEKTKDGAFPVIIPRYLYFVGSRVILQNLILYIGKDIFKILNFN